MSVVGKNLVIKLGEKVLSSGGSVAWSSEPIELECSGNFNYWVGEVSVTKFVVLKRPHHNVGAWSKQPRAKLRNFIQLTEVNFK